MSGNVQVLRFEPRATLDICLHMHQLGHLRPETARTLSTPVRIYHDDLPGARAALKSALAAREGLRGRKPNHALDMVFAGPPRFYTEGAWPDAKIDEWARDVVAWARDLMGPNTVFSSAGLHMDEAAPHLHLLCVPIDAEGRLGWKTVLREAGERLGTGYAAGKPRPKGADYTFVQDHLYENVSRKYGLSRGERKSKAKHQPTDRAIGLERAIEILEAQKQELKTEAAELRTARDQAEARADEIHAQLVVETRAMVGDAQARARHVIDSAGTTADGILATAEETARRQAEEDSRLGKAGGVALSKTAREGRRLRAEWEQKVALLEADLATTKKERDTALGERDTAQEEVVTVREQMRVEKTDLSTRLANMKARAEQAEASLERLRLREHAVRPAALSQARQEHEATVQRMTQEHQAVVEERDRLKQEKASLASQLASATALVRKAASVGKATLFTDELLPVLREMGVVDILSNHPVFVRLLRASARQQERHRAERERRGDGDG